MLHSKVIKKGYFQDDMGDVAEKVVSVSYHIYLAKNGYQ